MLENRGVVSLRGDDSRGFLQGLVTNDVERVSEENAIWAALLTPQGKIIADYIAHRTAEGVHIDVHAEAA